MQIFLVGGAVRDTLLNYPVREKDWVVIGETPESMIAQGFMPVGKDFPVFLHPKTQEEYALARTERKVAPGYKGFTVHASPDVTLEDDLIRRDLTINAIARHEDGTLIDPFGGQQDLEARIFRHVSPAFREDPVRILRLARFAARYAHLGFTIADETLSLMKQMVTDGETTHLVPERVWAELNKALTDQSPSSFFYTLKECHALKSIFPEIDRLFGVPQPSKHHPEVDTGVHTLMVLEQAAKLSDKPTIRLAALLHDLGKAETDKDKWPSHHGHEQLGIPVLNRLCKRLRVPKAYKILATHVMFYHTHCHRVFDIKASTLVDMLAKLGAFKANSSVVDDFLLACKADARGRTGFESVDYPQENYILEAAKAACSVDTSEITKGELQGAAIGEAIRRLRIKAVADYIQSLS